MATHLIDRSALARLRLPSVRPLLEPLLLGGRVATTGIAMIEFLASARSASDFDGSLSELDALPSVAVNERIVDRALDYDKDFDLIADATGQPMEWIVPQGSV